MVVLKPIAADFEREVWTRGEHANKLQGSNQESSCCKVTVLTTAPPCITYKILTLHTEAKVH